MPPQRARFLRRFGLKTGIDFARCGKFEMDFKISCLNSGLNSTYSRSENGYGFKRPGLKTGMENNIFGLK